MLLAIATLFSTRPIHAQTIDRIDVQRRGADAEVLVRFDAPVDYVRHAPAGNGRELLVWLQPQGGGPLPGHQNPETLQLQTDLVPQATVNYRGAEGVLHFRFARATEFNVRQGPDRFSLLVTLPALPRSSDWAWQIQGSTRTRPLPDLAAVTVPVDRPASPPPPQPSRTEWPVHPRAEQSGASAEAALEGVGIVRRGEAAADITLHFNGPIRLGSTAPAQSGKQMRIDASPAQGSTGSTNSRTYRGPQTDLVPRFMLSFPTPDHGMLIAFDRPTEFAVRPGNDARSLVISVPVLEGARDYEAFEQMTPIQSPTAAATAATTGAAPATELGKALASPPAAVPPKAPSVASVATPSATMAPDPAAGQARPGAAAPAMPRPPKAPPNEPVKLVEEVFATLIVNTVTMNDSVFVGVDAAGRLYLGATDFPELPLRAQPEVVEAQGTKLLRISELDGLEARLDRAQAQLDLRVLPSLMKPGEFNLSDLHRAQKLTPPATGARMNYSVTALQNASSARQGSMFWEPAVFNEWGIARSGFMSGGGRGTQRLDTTAVIDVPERRESWVLGDNVTRPGYAFGAAQKYFGAQWGSAFDLDPSFDPYGNYSLFVNNELPAVVRMMSEGRVMSTLEVPLGPFNLTNLPTPNVSGNLTVSVTDKLGNVRLFEIPYLRTAKLYHEGVFDYLVAGGMPRIDSGDTMMGRYRGGIFSTTLRYGMTPLHTGEVHADAGGKTVAAGATVTSGWVGPNLLSTVTLAASHDPAGGGALWGGTLARLEPRTSNEFGASVGFSRQSPRFAVPHAEQGIAGGTSGALRQQTLLQLGYYGLSLPLSMSFQATRFWDAPSKFTASLSSSTTIAGLALGLQFIAQRPGSGSLLLFTMNLPLENNHNLYAQINRSRESTYLQGDFVHPAPHDTGIGYRLTGMHTQGRQGTLSNGETIYLEGRTAVADFTAALNSSQKPASGSTSDTRLTATGSIGWLDGQLFPARSLDAPFALVRTGDARELPLYRNYTQVADSGSGGWAIIPGLTPYMNNSISFKPEEAQFDVSIDEVLADVKIAPYARGGIVVDFPLFTQNTAMLVINDGGGNPLPPGSRIDVVETGEKAFITDKGQVFLTRVRGASLQLRIDAGRFGRCEVRLEVPKDLKPDQRITGLVCPIRKELQGAQPQPGG